MIQFSAQRVTKTIRRILGNGDVCMYLVEGTESAILIDTGYGIGDLRGYVEELLAGKPYEVILTHGHVDHAAGAAQFDRCWINPADFNLYEEHAVFGFRKPHVLERHFKDFGRVEDGDWVGVDSSVLVPLKNHQTFVLGGVTVEIVYAPGHTPGIIVPVFIEDRLALFGDACGVGTLVVEPFSTTLKTFLESLLSLKRQEAKWDFVLREHGTFCSTKSVLGDNIELARQVLAGTDAAEPVAFQSRNAYRAARTDPVTGARVDGREGNLIYSRELVC